MKFINNIKAISLIELVLSMTIVSIGLTSIVLAFYQVTLNPLPQAEQQALKIAKGYLAEVLNKNFPTTLPCPLPPINRADYTNVCDYNNLVNNGGARDSKGNLILGLGAFDVAVSLDVTTATLGGLIAGSQIIRIDVTVTNSKQLKSKLIISSYKGKH